MPVAPSIGVVRPSDPDTPPNQPGLILQVEDSAAARYTRRRALEQAGFRVIDAGRVSEGWEAVLRERPDVVLTDIRLPDGDGYELTRRIKTDATLATTRVVQVSAVFTDAESRVRGLDSGADAYIIEPTEAAELVAVVRAMVRGRRTEELFTTVLEGSPMLVAAVDVSGRVTMFNAACEALTGFPRSEVVGRRFLETLVTPDDHDKIARRFERGTDAELATPHETRWRTAAGEDVDVEWRSFRAVAPDGSAWLLGIGHDVTSRKRTDAALRESQARLSLALDNAQMGMWELNLTTGTCAWSPQTALLFGLPRGSNAGSLQVFLDLVVPEDRERVLHAVQAVGDHGAYDVEFRTKWPDGSTHWIRGTGDVVPTPDGRERRLLGIGQDITERKRAQEVLRASEERFRSLSGSSPVGIFQADTAGRCTYTNPRAGAICGFTFEESLGTGWTAFIHPEDRDRVVSSMKAAFAAHLEYHDEFRWQHGDGRVRWTVCRAAPQVNDAGDVIGYVGTLEDTTERSAAEAQVRLSNELLQTIINGTSAVVYVVDEANRFQLINRQFAELFGVDPASAMGKTLYDYFPREVADQFSTNNRRVLEAGQSIEFEETVPGRGGSRTYVSVKAPLLDADGRAYAVCGVSTDISEHKRLLAALGEANRQKDAAMATVAHELRQPLGAIQAALGVMRQRTGRDTGERARHTVERQVAQLGRLVEDLIDAARIIRGKVELKRVRLRLHDVIEGTIAGVQPLAAERGQHLDVSLPPDPIWLDADAARLQQVFSNLLTNAVKFTPRGGRIGVVAGLEDGEVTVRVRDTGRGIAPDVLPRIFDLFAQERSDSGLGIGLAVVRGLLEQHGGSVEAHSAGVGLGSEFVVRLPAVSPAGTD